MTELIAEIGLAHEGSLGLAHSYIDLAASLKIDTVKFQMHIANEESSIYENFRINFSYQDKNRFEYWDRTSFSIEEWEQLINHSKSKNLNFLISPFSLKAIEEINKLGLDRLKLGSAETYDDLFVERALEYEFDFIVSNGFCNESIFEIIDLFKSRKKNLTVLECSSKYPSLNRDFNNERYKLLQNIKDIGYGVSDHSSETSILKYAISTGADIVEAHIVFDKRMFGPDSCASLDPSQWEEIVKFRNDIKEIKSKQFYKIESKMQKTFSRSIIFNKNLSKDQILTKNDFNSIKANRVGVPSKKYKNYVGKKLIKDVKHGNFLKESDVKNEA